MSEEIEYLTLEEIHAELLAMLCRAGEWFKANGIRYSLSDGSLLGAVRHRGFIPWDDDLDLYMPRPDYERWLSLSSEFGESTGFKVRSSKDRSYYYPFAKFVNPQVRAQEISVIGGYKGYLWIDVFPIDGVPSDEREYKRLVEWRKIKEKLINVCMTKSVDSKKQLVKRLMRPIVTRATDPYDLANEIDRKMQETPYETSERVSCPAYGFTFAGKSIPREGFEHMVELPFEGTMQPCMSCWDEYLSKSYGDYMMLPPEEKRWHHPQKTWRVDS